SGAHETRGSSTSRRPGSRTPHRRRAGEAGMARPIVVPRTTVRAVLVVAGLTVGAHSLAGGERGTVDTVPSWFPSGPPSREFLATLPKDVQVDNFGNAWVTRGSGSPHVLVLVRRDAPGWLVSQITPDGYLRVQRLGSGASP